jgi:hypothetical protein
MAVEWRSCVARGGRDRAGFARVPGDDSHVGEDIAKLELLNRRRRVGLLRKRGNGEKRCDAGGDCEAGEEGHVPA